MGVAMPRFHIKVTVTATSDQDDFITAEWVADGLVIKFWDQLDHHAGLVTNERDIELEIKQEAE